LKIRFLPDDIGDTLMAIAFSPIIFFFSRFTDVTDCHFNIAQLPQNQGKIAQSRDASLLPDHQSGVNTKRFCCGVAIKTSIHRKIRPSRPVR